MKGKLKINAKYKIALEPFKKFLSSKIPFKSNDELNAIFEYSKGCTMNVIKEGVSIFDITRPSCLRNNCSEKEIGYFLSRQHCKCKSREFCFCLKEWRITHAGFRFLRDSEEDYSPMERESLNVA